MTIEANAQPTRRRPKRTVKIIGGVTALVVLGICSAGIIAAFSSGGHSAPPEPTADGAVAACEGFVKDRLKAPATASFGVEQVSKKDRTYVVANTVDAENSFGAKLRMNYACTVTANADGGWHLDSLAGLDQP